jgi:hypothetical protein
MHASCESTLSVPNSRHPRVDERRKIRYVVVVVDG